MESEISPLLVEFRKLLVENKLDAYVIPRTDPHDSEILPSCDERLKFISSFSGSNGIAVISNDQALMWTDSRYYLQAPQELQPGWQMMKMAREEIQWSQWLIKNIPQGGRVGVNPFLMNSDGFTRHEKNLKDKGIELVPLVKDLVEELWKDRPAISRDPVFILENKYSGKPASEKLTIIGEKLQALGATSYIVTSLEEIAWVLNLRGSDCESTPYFTSYLVLNYQEGSSTGTLYIIREKVPAEVEEYLKTLNITLKGYDQVLGDVAAIEGVVYVDKSIANHALCNALKDKKGSVTSKPNIIDKLKAIKNSTEIQGFTDCHVRDGAAVTSYFAWVERALTLEQRKDLDEYNATLKLNQLRYEKQLNKGLSFPAISSIGPNAAIVHYNPKEGSAARLNVDQIYLLDSGGQYLDGTTDVTRTTHFGIPSAEEKDAYTRVLLGNLDVERVVIPNDGSHGGADIDVLARRHLWNAGLDYGHGTGHGVGHFLNVHEGPHGISKYRTIAFEEGMIVTNEPGYYKEGGFGIRIENILVVEKRGDGAFLGFRNITLVPYERNLINLDLLSDVDIDYIDRYHKRVYDTLSHIYKETHDNISLNYLSQKCAPLHAK